LNEAQTRELLVHLEEHTYTKGQDICAYIQAKYQITYTVSGITSWLKGHKFSYKKPKVTPLKSDAEKQKAFIEYYQNLKGSVGEDEPTLFVDSVHHIQLWQPKWGMAGLSGATISL
jgi:hypothetical protein